MLSRELLERPERAGLLERLDPARLNGQDARVAFWLNVYNARLRSELAARPRSGSLLRHRRLFRRSTYRVGRLEYSLDVIEHGLLRRNARPPYGVRRLLRGSDPRLAAAPARLDPRVHFALNCGARSCPVVRPYDDDGLDHQLDAATRQYLVQESELDHAEGRATLPGLCRLYRRDFGGEAGVRSFAARHLGEDLTGLEIRFGRFDWTMMAPA